MVLAEGMKKDTSHMFVLQAVALRIIVSALNSKLHVAETFESKHLPVELLLFSKEYQSTSKDRSVLEKLVWDSVKKRSFLSNQLGVRCFKVLSFKLTDLLTRSVDEAVNCLNSGLLEAAACMKRKIYEGPKSSKWFDVECKAARKETRKWWREFRRSKC